MDFKELEIEKRWLLLTRIDQGKFLYFHEKYWERIYRYCYRRTLNRDVAEDLTSETFLRAQSGLWKFRFQGMTMGAWLYRIAYNVIREHAKDLRRTPPTADSGELLPTAEADPLEDLLQSEDQRLLRKLMAQQLDDLGRAVIELHYWGDLRTSEIAVVLKISEGTVKSRLARDRDKLKKCLAARRARDLRHELPGIRDREYRPADPFHGEKESEDG